MHVRGALLDGVEQHLVDEADDRRVFDVVARDALLQLLLAGADLEVLQVEVVLGHRRHRGVDLLDGLGDGQLELVVLDDDRLDAEARGELDLVDGMKVGRIGDREEQALSTPHERQHPMLVEQLVADELDRVQVEADRVQVQQRDAELVRCGNGDLASVGRAAVHQLGDDADPPLLRGGHGFHHGGLVDEAILDQALRQSADGRFAGAERHHCVVIHWLARCPKALEPAPKSTEEAGGINC